MASFFSQAQTKPELVDSKEIINKGVELYDEKKYSEACEYFNQIHPLDTNYLTAQYELSLTLIAQEKYQEAIDVSLKLIKLNTSEPLQYNILGTAYDNIKEYDKALSAYNVGLKKFPYNDNLMFNRSVVFEVKGEIKNAINSHIKHLNQNPFNPSTHLRLGILFLKEGFYTQSILSLTTFLMLEPASGRSLNVLNVFNQLAEMSSDLANTVKTDGLTNEFEDIDFLIKNKVALNKKYKVPAELEFSFVKQLYLVLEKLNEQKTELGDGFWAKHYAPFYIELFNSKKFDFFSMLISASSTNEKIQKKLTKNLEKIKLTSTESKSNWKRLHDEFELELGGNKQTVQQWYNSNNSISALGKENEKKENIGDYIFIGSGGFVSAIGNYIEGKKNGEWTYFYANSDTLKIVNFTNDKGNGNYQFYFDNNRVKESGYYKDGELDGIIKLFYPNGILKYDYNFKSGKKDGIANEYYNFGAIKATYVYEAGELNGEVVQYHANGKVKFKASFIKGKREGKSIEYYDNGQEKSVATYINNETDGEYKQYYQNGKIDRQGKLAKSINVGEWKYYDNSGVLTSVKVWDDNGKENGDVKLYTIDGKVYSEELYSKGELKNMKYFNSDGSLFKEFKLSKGTGKVVYYDQNLDLISEGKFINTQNDGNWKYYSSSSTLKSNVNYKLNKLNGEYIRYFENGSIDFKCNYKNDEREGLYEEYFDNKANFLFGNFINGDKWGEWIEFYKDGTVKNVLYYSEGQVRENRAYAVNGKPSIFNLYDKNYEIEKTIIFDTTGVVIDTLFYPSGKFEMQRVSHIGKPYLKATVYGNTFHGQATWLFPNGKLNVSGDFINDEKNGKWIWNHPNGKISTTGNYHNGDQIGKWENYNIFGVKILEREYDFNMLVGKYTRLDDQGKTESITEYRNGEKHGENSFFAPNGELKIIRYYNLNKLIGYAYQNSQKKLIEMIPIVNETAEIKANYPNGQTSVEYAIKNGEFYGKMTHYYPSGKIMRVRNYENDSEVGENKDFYENGKLKIVYNYKSGKKNGVEIAYYEDGNVKYSLQYLNDELHGKADYFDKTGKKIHSYVYYNDEVVSL